MKNILILTTVSGFLKKFEMENVKILQSMGYMVHYAANMNEQHYPFDEKELERAGIRLHHIDIARSPYMLNYNMKAFWQLAAIIKQNHICAIHCHTPVGGMLGRQMGWWFRRRQLQIIYTAHGFHFYKGAPFINNTIYYFVERFLAHFTDLLVVINKEDYKNAKKFHLRKNGKVYHIPGIGLDLERFSPLTEKERREKRKKLGITEDDFFLVSVGELNENKNQQIILRALEQMRRAGKDISKIKYGICGDGFFREKIERMIQTLGLEHNVRMFGYCMDVRELLGCADVSVFPSRREGLGMAGLEALAMEIPLLAAENRGTREYLKPGINGYFCESDSVSSWINGLETIRNLAPNVRQEMKRMCRKSAEVFGKENTNAIMKLVYQDLDKRLECVRNGRKGEDQCHHGCV